MLASQRALFEMARSVCYLNSASYSPLPRRTLDAGRVAVARKGTPWTLDWSFAAQQYERARAAAARLINADTGDIALIASVSYGVATAAKVLTVARGTRVIVLQDDHASPVLEWHARADAGDFTVETVRRPTMATGHLPFSGPSRSRVPRRSASPRSPRCTGRTAGCSTSRGSP
jgi:selenocysteine lyase/cysteine desulfurase